MPGNIRKNSGVTKRRCRQFKGKNHFSEKRIQSSSTQHLNSSAAGPRFPGWSSESRARLFPPSHVCKPRPCRAGNTSQQPLCLHGLLAGWLRPERGAETPSWSPTTGFSSGSEEKTQQNKRGKRLKNQRLTHNSHFCGNTPSTGWCEEITGNDSLVLQM